MEFLGVVIELEEIKIEEEKIERVLDWSTSKGIKDIVSTVEMNIACLNSQLTMTRIVSKLDKKNSFSMKSMEIEYYRHLVIRSCLSNSYSL